MIATKMRLGDLLVEGGLITESQLQSALDIQKQSGGKKLGSILVDLGIVSEEQMLEVLRKRLNISMVHLSDLQSIGEKVLALIPEEMARERLILPYKLQGNTLYIVTSDPLDFATLNHLGAATGRAIEPILATKTDISISINKYYNRRTMETMASTINAATATQAADLFSGVDLEEIESRVGEVPVVKFINNLIAQAQSKRASDVHIEPLIDAVRIRFRIDGELVEVVRMNHKALSSLITRVKIMAGMDIAERRIPLDGRFSVDIEDKQVSIRAASMPTLYGEKIVLRLMADSKSGVVPLEALGADEAQSRLIRSAIRSPNGLILVTGPTGSGKSTTLYSLLKELAEDSTNVLTVEDPIEKAVPGVNQTQVNPKAGLTFATGLRAILRQDPDKIMIGEVRDVETADIAARAAITGHLVLASMHTNSAAAAYMRLVDMGIEPYVVASSVVAVVAQRLLRLICPHCKKPQTLTEADRHFLQGLGAGNPPALYYGAGCERCDYTGYLGRSAIFEIVATDPHLRDMIVSKAKSSDIEQYLTRERNQKYMLDHGLQLVMDGKVALGELMTLTQGIEL